LLDLAQLKPGSGVTSIDLRPLPLLGAVAFRLPFTRFSHWPTLSQRLVRLAVVFLLVFLAFLLVLLVFLAAEVFLAPRRRLDEASSEAGESQFGMMTLQVSGASWQAGLPSASLQGARSTSMDGLQAKVGLRVLHLTWTPQEPHLV
jgi:hypothetical protein